MAANNFDSPAQLEGYFVSRVLDLATLAGRSYIVWQVKASQLSPAVRLLITYVPALATLAGPSHLGRANWQH